MANTNNISMQIFNLKYLLLNTFVSAITSLVKFIHTNASHKINMTGIASTLSQHASLTWHSLENKDTKWMRNVGITQLVTTLLCQEWSWSQGMKCSFHVLSIMVVFWEFFFWECSSWPMLLLLYFLLIFIFW